MEDWELLRSYLAGDRTALQQLVLRHVDFVYATARRQVGPDDADDITQAVFLLLTRKARRIQQRGSMVGWLYRATRYCSANLRRVEARRRQHLQEAAMRASPSSTPSDPPWIEDLDAALGRIGEVDRQAVLLHFVGRRTFEETGRALGLSAEAVRKRVDRALVRLRLYLTGRGHAMPECNAIGAVLAASALKAPALTAQAALTAASGAPVAPLVSALARQAGQSMLLARVKATLAATCIVGAIAASFIGLMILMSPLRDALPAIRPPDRVHQSTDNPVPPDAPAPVGRYP